MKFKELLSAIKQKVFKVFSVIFRSILEVVLEIKRLIVKFVFNPITLGVVGLIVGFIFGGRLHEIGMLEGVGGKTLKNATVFLSGPCKVNGITRNPALAEDEVKITGIEDGQIVGVVRKTREVVVCDPEKVAIDKLPLLANLSKSPVAIPELEAMKIEVKEPDYKQLIQKTLIMSGSCVSVSGRELPAFTDEQVDVTNVEGSKENPELFTITGIKKSDKIAISCLNTAVKYSLYEEPVEKVPSVLDNLPKIPKSFVGETLLITSTCFPDPRLPKHKQDKKVAFYPLVNSPVQITEESLDTNGKLKKLAGAALSFGAMVVCDGEKFPLTYKEYDPETMKLNSIKTTEQGVEAEKATEATPAKPVQDVIEGSI